ncbi:hypothetical protein DFH07DRAFT_834543 [Mycena maculata]|uniref:DUF302 domain-containing protein n=1 Tax=Mycena maculata TaxID=230809 RepID=A0AAD7N3A1_9AGAR|nr:hypothetical protein DFH07DRAFT_834543 [Mycena maculata]
MDRRLMPLQTNARFKIRRFTFSTTLAISEVLSRLDEEIKKPPSPGTSLLTRGSTSKEELQTRVDSAVGPSGFLFFNEYNHGAWLQFFSSTPRVVVYVIGNPLIAQTMFQHDLRGAFNIPPRLLVLEKADGTGTEVRYHLPSSVMVLDDNAKLRAAAEALDIKLESLVERITAV